MHKLTKVAVVVGLVTALTTAASQAAFFNNNNQQQPNSSVSTDPDCTALMGYMRTPKAAEIEHLTAGRVVLTAVCEDLTIPGRNEYGALFVNGNAELLRRPIARNPLLINALRARQYDQNDVVSVRFGGNDSIILYVHQRDLR